MNQDQEDSGDNVEITITKEVFDGKMLCGTITVVLVPSLEGEEHRVGKHLAHWTKTFFDDKK
jgi:hypothetical protein